MRRTKNSIDEITTQVYTKTEIKTGLKLMAEIGGLVIMGFLASFLVAVIIPQLGIVIAGGLGMKTLQFASKMHTNYSKDQKRMIRGAIKLLKGRIKTYDLIDE